MIQPHSSTQAEGDGVAALDDALVEAAEGIGDVLQEAGEEVALDVEAGAVVLAGERRSPRKCGMGT